MNEFTTQKEFETSATQTQSLLKMQSKRLSESEIAFISLTVLQGKISSELACQAAMSVVSASNEQLMEAIKSLEKLLEKLQKRLALKILLSSVVDSLPNIKCPECGHEIEDIISAEGKCPLCDTDLL